MSMFHELMMKKKGIPSRYQEVEYIESTGTQWIDTDIKGADNIGIKATISDLTISGDTNFLGARITGGQRLVLNYNGGYWGYGFNSYVKTDIVANVNQKNVLELNFKNSRVFKANEDSVNISDTITNEIPALFLFRQRTTSESVSYSYKMYGCQISQGNSVIRNYIPVYDTLTQKYGMWETVQGKFYGNDGTGDFTGA